MGTKFRGPSLPPPPKKKEQFWWDKREKIIEGVVVGVQIFA